MRRKLTSRMLAALLAVVMVVGLLPMTALAARVIPDDAPMAEAAMGEEAVTAPVRAPSKAAVAAAEEETPAVEYEYVLDTDGIDDRGVYVIYSNYNETKDRLLYYSGSGELTNLLPATLSGDTLGLNTDPRYPANTQLWEAEAVEGGIALKSLAADMYLKVQSSSTHAHIDVSDTPQALTITANSASAGRYKVVQNGWSLNWSGSGFYTHNADNNYYVRFFKQTPVVTEPETPEEPETPVEKTKLYFESVDEGAWKLGDGTGNVNTISTHDIYDPNDVNNQYPNVNSVNDEGNYRIWATGGFLNFEPEGENLLLTTKAKTGKDSPYVHIKAQSCGAYIISHVESGETYYLTNKNQNNQAVFSSEETDAVPYVIESAGGVTYRIWCKGPYTVSFDGGYEGAEDIASLEGVYYGTVLPTPADREGYTFLGWFDDNGNKYTGVTADVALTAQWEEEPETPSGTTPLIFLSPDSVEEGYEVKYLSFGSTGWNMSSAAYAVKLYELVDPEGAVTSNSVLQAATAPALEGRYAIARSGNEHLMHFTAHGASNHTEYTNQCGFSNSKLGGCAEGHLAAFEAVEGKENAYRIHGVLDTGNNHYVSTEPDPAAVNGNNGSPIEELKLTAEGAEFFISPVAGQSGSYYIWTAVEIRIPGPEDLAQTVFTGTSTDGPFNEGQTNSTFRIPALVTLDNGWIVAAADVRWPDTADSPNNLDTIVSVSKDGGETWDWEVVNYFSDFAALYGVGRKWYSASFIDPALAVDGDGTLWMAVDLQPAHVNLGQNAQKTGSGFDEDGYLMVGPISESEWETKVNTSLGRDEATRGQYEAYYEYRVNINSVHHTPDVTTTKNGKTVSLYPVFHKDTGATNGYYVDAFFDLYYDYGEGGIKPVLVAQKESDKYTQANLFYVQSPWKAYSTTYLMIRKATVEGDGLVWGDPRLVSGVKYYGDNRPSTNEASETFLAFCPGRGTVTTVNGKERIIFPVYDNANGEKCSVVYTEDGGATWTRGARIPTGGVGKTSESQIVVLPVSDDPADGTFLRIYSRNTAGKISYADSTDGGATWTASQADNELKYGDNVMVSFINLKGYLLNEDGTIYGNLILGSYPWGTKVNGEHNRSNGVVRIGTFDPKTKDVTWLNENEIRYPGRYNYSCLTQLLDENNKPTDGFGLLYEVDGGNGMLIPYVSLTTADLMGEGWTLVQELPAIPSVDNTIQRDEDEETPSVVAEAGVLDLDMGATGALTAKVSFTDGKQDDAPAVVAWSSSDERVATVSTQTAQASLLSGEEVVNERAVITAVGPGRAVITATVTKNGVTSKASETEVVVQGENEITVPGSYANEEVTEAEDETGATTYTVNADGLQTLIQAGGDQVQARDYAKTLALAATYTDKEKADLAQTQIDETTKALYAQLTGREYDWYTIGTIGDRSHTGKAIEPPVIVRRNGAIITAGYTLEYKNNVDEGVATVEVWVGDKIVATGTFNIVPDDTDDIVDNSASSIGSASGGSSIRYPAPAPAEEDLEDPDVPLAQAPMTFVDVKLSDWFCGAAQFVFAKNLMQGVSATEFRPTMNTTRGMVVTILHRMEEEPKADPATFMDVASDAWYGPAVAWGVESDVVKGADDGGFHPTDDVTREQLALFLYRFAQHRGYDVSTTGDLSGYADGETVSGWAADAMGWAVGTGLITGKDGNALDPLSTATRAELATILTRFCERFVEEK